MRFERQAVGAAQVPVTDGGLGAVGQSLMGISTGLLNLAARREAQRDKLVQAEATALHVEQMAEAKKGLDPSRPGDLEVYHARLEGVMNGVMGQAPADMREALAAEARIRTSRALSSFGDQAAAAERVRDIATLTGGVTQAEEDLNEAGRMGDLDMGLQLRERRDGLLLALVEEGEISLEQAEMRRAESDRQVRSAVVFGEFLRSGNELGFALEFAERADPTDENLKLGERMLAKIRERSSLLELAEAQSSKAAEDMQERVASEFRLRIEDPGAPDPTIDEINEAVDLGTLDANTGALLMKQVLTETDESDRLVVEDLERRAFGDDDITEDIDRAVSDGLLTRQDATRLRNENAERYPSQLSVTRRQVSEIYDERDMFGRISGDAAIKKVRAEREYDERTAAGEEPGVVLEDLIRRKQAANPMAAISLTGSRVEQYVVRADDGAIDVEASERSAAEAYRDGRLTDEGLDRHLELMDRAKGVQ